MTVGEFLAHERAALEAEHRGAGIGLATPIRARLDFIQWLEEDEPLTDEQFVEVLRDVVATGKVRDRLEISPDYARELLERWERSKSGP